MALLEVEDLAVQFRTRSGVVRAVKGVSFSVEAGEVVGLVGESGSGKSVTSLALMGITPGRHTEVTATRLRLDQTDLLSLSRAEYRRHRGRDLAMVFQNPTSSLNPIVRISKQITEALRAHESISGAEALRRSRDLLAKVGIADPDRVMNSYPHRLSGGMCQRVMIAIALALRPKLLIADEPTTALDVTVQAQVLEVLRELTREAGTAVILITHDLGVVAAMAQRVNVMYAGRVVEAGSTVDVFARPRHPYTVGLLHSVARSDRDSAIPLIPIPGQPPDPQASLEGCAFAPRCAWQLAQCATDLPLLQSDHSHEGGQRFACHHPVTAQEVTSGRPLSEPFVSGSGQ